MSEAKKALPKQSVMRNNWFLFRFILRRAPFWVLGDLFFYLATSLPWSLAEILLPKYIIDTVAGGQALDGILPLVLLFISVLLLGESGSRLFTHLYAGKAQERLSLLLQTRLYEKAVATDLAAYDDPHFYDDFIMAMDTAQGQVRNIMSGIRYLIGDSISVVTISALIMRMDRFALALIVLAALAMLPLGRRRAKLSFEKTQAANPPKRRGLYFSRVFYLVDYAKELRLSRSGELLRARYTQSVQEQDRVVQHYNKKLWKIDFLQESLPFTLMIACILLLYLGYRVLVQQALSMGAFVATFNSASEIGYTLFFLFSHSIQMLRENSLFIGKLRTFLDSEPTIRDGGAVCESEDVPQTLCLEDVSFTYPGAKQAALKHISLTIPPYQKVALVGYNGAGKTTLTNLLLRLYEVGGGRITVGGQDIRALNLQAHRGRFSAVFQDFRLFAATVAENVAMDTDADAGAVEQALRESGFGDKLSRLPQGIHTQLLREFDENGTELSGGEAQKVAVAGAFYRNRPFILLDEPSANLDPASEYQLNRIMARAAKDKTVIFISHRLSTTRMADVIYMLENGEIAESGSHDELMAKNGKYAQMFRMQASKYQEA